MGWVRPPLFYFFYMAALTLDLSYSQFNDATTLTLTDTTSNWGSNDNSNVDVTDPDEWDNASPDYFLELDVTVYFPSGTSTTYDTLDLVAEFGDNGTTPSLHFSAQSAMVYEITADMLESGGDAMSSSGDELLDGIYKVTYTLYSYSPKAVVDQLVEYIPVYGKIRMKVFDQLRLANTIYEQTNEDVPVYSHEFEDILDALNKYSLFLGAQSRVSLSNQEKVLNTLDALQRLTVND